MKDEKKNMPKVRFSRFSDAWELRKLGGMSEHFEYGLNASAKKFDGINKYIRITDIDDVSHKFIQNKLTSPDTDFNSADNYLLKRGDILFARTGASVGKTYCYQLNDGKTYYAGFLIRARIKPDYSPEFIFQNTLTSRYDNFVKITSQRSGQPGINAQEYVGFEIMVPKKDEQTKIGTFFKYLDDTIALHKRKLEALKEMKKGFLQQLFPQKGEKVPRVRFADFHDEWELRKLGEVFNQKVEYVNPQIANLELWSVTVKNGLTPKIERFNREALVKKNDKFKVVHPGDIVYNPMNMTIGAVGFNQTVKTVAVSGYYVTMSMKYGFSNGYFNTWLPSTQAIQIYKLYATGSLIEKQRVQFPTLSKIKTPIPKYEEQEKMGNFFDSFQYTISLYQKKLEQLKMVKKAYLQNMFI